MRKDRWISLKENQNKGVSLAVVLCVSAFFIAFSAAILYTAGLLTSQSTRRLEQERSYLRNQLAALGAKVYGSEANYIFFYLPKPENLPELLHERGYLIRSCANYHNLQAGYYRIAVKTRVQNRGLIKALKEAIKTCALY